MIDRLSNLLVCSICGETTGYSAKLCFKHITERNEAIRQKFEERIKRIYVGFKGVSFERYAGSKCYLDENIQRWYEEYFNGYNDCLEESQPEMERLKRAVDAKDLARVSAITGEIDLNKEIKKLQLELEAIKENHAKIFAHNTKLMNERNMLISEYQSMLDSDFNNKIIEIVDLKIKHNLMGIGNDGVLSKNRDI